MKDPRIQRLAEMMVQYSADVQPKQKVLLRGSAVAQPLLLAIYQEVLQAGAYPFLMPSLPGAAEIFYKIASDDQLGFVPEPVKLAMETFDVMFNVIADENTRALNNVDPHKMVLASRASEPVTRMFLERAARGELKWSLTLFPTQAHAQDAEMSLTEFEDFVYQACMPDMNDPVGYWKRVHAQQQKICDWLDGKENVHVIGKETDLTLSIRGRKFINCACHENVPDGEIFTGPVEDSANGTVYFSYPAIYGGREVEGVRLWFENGKVIKAKASKNEDFLLKTLDTDEGSRYLGEFAIGTNEGITKFTREILFDEKIGGSFHMALGSGYPETGSVNQSAIHWDMICDLRDGGEIWADDTLLYKNGKFALDLS
ncbi:MAG TPA: aminopeptidase [Anaerolineaceae bacterium]|mgnify:FL=1|nr:aminopeptidase [Anaerolineaceae bacterium]